MTQIFPQDFLKVVTRLVEDEEGQDAPVVRALKSAWNNDDPALHQAALDALKRLGAVRFEGLMARAWQMVHSNDRLSGRR
jgi:hypothetical protein